MIGLERNGNDDDDDDQLLDELRTQSAPSFDKSQRSSPWSIVGAFDLGRFADRRRPVSDYYLHHITSFKSVEMEIEWISSELRY
jgi:hypothetical protein